MPFGAKDGCRMESNNPALKGERFHFRGEVIDMDHAMEMTPTLFKAILLVCLMAFATGAVWFLTLWQHAAPFPYLLESLPLAALFGALILWKPRLSPFLSPFFALAAGGVLGSVSAYAETFLPGWFTTAICLTYFVFAIVMILYFTKTISLHPNWQTAVFVALLALALMYGIALPLALFGFDLTWFLGVGFLSTLFSLFVVGSASLHFLADLEELLFRIKEGAPPYMEWYGAFGLLVTFFWLYTGYYQGSGRGKLFPPCPCYIMEPKKGSYLRRKFQENRGLRGEIYICISLSNGMHRVFVFYISS